MAPVPAVQRGQERSITPVLSRRDELVDWSRYKNGYWDGQLSTYLIVVAITGKLDVLPINLHVNISVCGRHDIHPADIRENLHVLASFKGTAHIVTGAALSASTSDTSTRPTG
jgi:hypothetical protein